MKHKPASRMSAFYWQGTPCEINWSKDSHHQVLSAKATQRHTTSGLSDPVNAIGRRSPVISPRDELAWDRSMRISRASV